MANLLRRFSACLLLSASAAPCILTPYSLQPGVDYPLAISAVALRGAAEWIDAIRYRDTTGYASLSPGRVGPYDRWAIGYYSRPLDRLSTGLTAAELAVPVALDLWESASRQEALSGIGTDLLIYSEVYCFSSSLAIFAKSLKWHPRPLAFTANAPAAARRSGDAGSSFFSAHTTSAFASAVFTGYTFRLKHPDSPLVPWVWGGMLGSATAVAALRVYSGKHFPSDVAAGAAVGGLFGYAVPRLHLDRVSKALNERVSGPGKPWDLRVVLLPDPDRGALPLPGIQARF